MYRVFIWDLNSFWAQLPTTSLPKFALKLWTDTLNCFCNISLSHNTDINFTVNLSWSFLFFVSTVFWKPCFILQWMSILYYLPFAFSLSFSSLVNHSLHQVTIWSYIFSHSYIFWYNLKNVVFIMTTVQPFLIICLSHTKPFLLVSITTVGFSYDSFSSLSVPLFSNPRASFQVIHILQNETCY